MKNFTTVLDVPDIRGLVSFAIDCKKEPLRFKKIGADKTLLLLFFNPSLRTRLSTQKAAMNIGMNVMVMNLNYDGWILEFENGAVMDQGKAEHIKEAASVVSQYADIIGLRTFPKLMHRKDDYDEVILNKFIEYVRVPIISLESATLHPLQSLADAITIEEFKTKAKPKVVLSWAPHPRALPQAVANSTVEWMKCTDVDFVVANPEGFDLAPQFANGVKIVHDQKEAFKDADFVYAKNWSSFEEYGKIGKNLESWRIDLNKMKWTNEGKFMHCLPVRRNIVVTDEVLDSNSSIVIEQANNRTFAAQAVLLKFYKMKAELKVIKIGGNIIKNDKLLDAFLADFSSLRANKILVHGGGNIATEISEKLGIEPQLVKGRRITGKKDLDVVIMVYGGLINKRITAKLQSNGCNSIGMSGVDFNSILAKKRPKHPINYGMVGDVKIVNSEAIQSLLDLGIAPVFCALTHDGKGNLLNTNADTIAAELAISLSKIYLTDLYYCFDKKGVLLDEHDEKSVIPSIDLTDYEGLKKQNIIKQGMFPKMENCFHALQNGVQTVRIGDCRMISEKESIHTKINL